jgi:hypothetical protein
MLLPQSPGWRQRQGRRTLFQVLFYARSQNCEKLRHTWLSVRMENSTPTERIFTKFYIWGVFEKSVFWSFDGNRIQYKFSVADSRVMEWKFSIVRGTNPVPILRMLLVTSCPVLWYKYLYPTGVWDGMPANPVNRRSSQVEEICPGCLSKVVLIVIGRDVRPNVKPATLLKFLGCNCICIACFAVWSMYVLVLVKLFFFILNFVSCVSYVLLTVLGAGVMFLTFNFNCPTCLAHIHFVI